MTVMTITLRLAFEDQEERDVDTVADQLVSLAQECCGAMVARTSKRTERVIEVADVDTADPTLDMATVLKREETWRKRAQRECGVR